MFQLIDTTNHLPINNTIAYYWAQYSIFYNNNSNIFTPLEIEPCEIGKNIDLKYKEYINDKANYGRKVEDFTCINKKHENISLFYEPDSGFSSIDLFIIFNNKSDYNPENVQSLILAENNIINHYNRDNPLSQGYIFQFTSAYNPLEFTTISYIFQYIKYEKDSGIFFPDTKTLYGLSFSDMTSYRNKQDNSNFFLTKNFEEIKNSTIGRIQIGINQSNFDNYRRSYKRLQSVIAEVLSIGSLLFEIGRQISNILDEKKRSVDIVEKLLNNKETFTKSNNINKVININDRIEESTKRKSILIDKMNSLNNLMKSKGVNFNFLNNKNNISKIEVINVNKKILNQINIFHILKSYLFFRDKTTQLINLYHCIIKEDMSVERILERFYNLEKINNFISNENKEKNKLIKKKRIKVMHKTFNKKLTGINESNNLEEEKIKKNNSVFK